MHKPGVYTKDQVTGQMEKLDLDFKSIIVVLAAGSQIEVRPDRSMFNLGIREISGRMLVIEPNAANDINVKGRMNR